MFVGINIFWDRLGLILARAVSKCITNIITLESIEKIKTEKKIGKTLQENSFWLLDFDWLLTSYD